MQTTGFSVYNVYNLQTIDCNVFYLKNNYFYFLKNLVLNL